MQSRLLKPSYLVSLKTSISGGISYNRTDLGKEDEDGTETLKWETTRVIEDKDEHERATRVRSKASSLIRAVCNPTSFGLICPLHKGEEFDAAVKEAREIASEFNGSSTYTKVSVYVLKGEIASTDEEAVRALSAEVSSMVEEMQVGIDNLDVKGIRDVAKKARQMLGALGEEQSKVLSDAVVQARKAATSILKRVKVDGEKAEVVLADIKRNDLDKARAAFLDYSEDADQAEALPAVERQRFADLDVEATG